MEPIILLAVGLIGLLLGVLVGYWIHQYLRKKRQDSLEVKIQQRLDQARKEKASILEKARRESERLIKEGQKKISSQEADLLKVREILLKKEESLVQRDSLIGSKEKQIEQQLDQLNRAKTGLDQKRQEIQQKLEEVANLTEKEAREELLHQVEEMSKKDLLAKMTRLEKEGKERYRIEAQKIIALAIQKYAISQISDLTTSSVAIGNEDVKGRIIGKSGRNIRAFERAAGVELVVDEAPGIVAISSHNPIRRRIAQLALEKLVEDGRIQPARIERVVNKIKEEVKEQIQRAGEAAVYETKIIDLPPKLVEILGRLHFRTSYGQNVLLHSIEVALIAETLASEIGANAQLAKKAGLLHDIGKAIDHQVEGSHIEIGIKILEKFGVEKEVIDAMKSHHEDYPYETVESVLVQAADAISGARPGARRENMEDFLKRLDDLESIAKSIKGVQDCYAIEAGREVRVLVKAEEIDDFEAKKIARDIVERIQAGLTYPGEIKVNVIRESRVVEYAR
ncbi:MAG TPA: ribonuclease Y [Candidatus Pacearchaeota archaeon]|nr:ribonuclease Y [Candidatus Pacearchaeota archaeon]